MSRGIQQSAASFPCMPTDLPLRCSCGSVRGVVRAVSPDCGNRLICYCDDCQSFIHYLGNAKQILDAHGGSDIFQTSPARLEISQGEEQLACMRLRPGGLVRWYTSCCKSPIGNTLATRQVAFVGLIHSFADQGGDGDKALGPVRWKVAARFAKGDRAELQAHDRAPVAFILRFMWIILTSRLRGDHKRSPFFDAASGNLRAQPTVLSAEELARVEEARDAV